MAIRSISSATRYRLGLQALLEETGADAVLLIHAPTAIVPSSDIARTCGFQLLPATDGTVEMVLEWR